MPSLLQCLLTYLFINSHRLTCFLLLVITECHLAMLQARQSKAALACCLTSPLEITKPENEVTVAGNEMTELRMSGSLCQMSRQTKQSNYRTSRPHCACLAGEPGDM